MQFDGFWQMNGILYHQLSNFENSSIIKPAFMNNSIPHS